MNGQDKKLGSAEINVESKFLKWLDNYWYHYKWTTIIVGFFVVVLLVCTLQMCTNEKEDINLIYAGPVLMTSGELDNLADVMNIVMPRDFDNSGEKSANILNYHVFSEDEIKKLESQTDSDGKKSFIDRSYNTSNYDNFYNYIQTGDASVCMVAPWLYDSLKSSNRLMKLTDVLGELPEAAIDDYGVMLSELEIYDSFSSVRVLPGDTVVCILRPLVIGKSSKEKVYAQEKEMFSAILEFGDEK